MTDSPLETQDHFRRLMEQSPVSIQIHDLDGRLLQWNAAYAKLFTLNADALAEHREKYNVRVDAQAEALGLKPFIERVYQGEDVVFPLYEYDGIDTLRTLDLKYPDSRRCWVQTRGFPLRDNRGNVTRAVFISEDITERMQADGRIQESEEHLRALIEQTPLAIEIHSVDGKFLTSNPAYSRISGLYGAELQAVKESYDLRQDEQLLRLGLGPLLERLYAGEVIEFPVHAYSVREAASGLGIEVANGDSIWLRTIGFPLKNSAAGRTEAVVLMTEDVTAQKMAEIKLATSEEKFHQMLAQSPLSIQILNPAGYLEEVNQAWMDLWGGKEEELEALKASWCILEDEQVTSLGLMPLVERAFRGERVVLPDIEYDAGPVFDAAGLPVVGAKKRWVRAHLYPVLDANGEVRNVVDVEEDITERKQAEERLRNYQDRLRSLASELTLTEEQERKRIATELHDGAAQSLAFARIQLASVKKTVGDAAAAKKLDDLSQLLKESLQQIRDVLLDLSSPALNEIGLAAALSEWLEEQIGRRHGLRTSFDNRAGVAPLTDNVRAVLFRNARELLMNMIKHAKAGKVSVRMETSGEMLRIMVEDDGVGFDPEAVAGRPNHEGAFGLFSIRERMADLGGTLEIESEPGKGCKATLVAPLEE